jgi:hypothetical protein
MNIFLGIMLNLIVIFYMNFFLNKAIPILVLLFYSKNKDKIVFFIDNNYIEKIVKFLIYLFVTYLIWFQLNIL